MATNLYQKDGRKIQATVATTVNSGDPGVLGTYTPYVALTDADSTSGLCTIDTDGVYKLTVGGKSAHSTDATVTAGDMLFYTSTATVNSDSVVINKDSSGEVFGIALTGVAKGAATEIPVKLSPVYVASASINAGKLASDAVTTAKILDLNVTTGKLAANAVTSGKIATSVIQTATKTFTGASIKQIYSGNTNKGLSVLAAPGADKVYEFLSAHVKYNYGADTAFVTASPVRFKLESFIVSTVIATAFLDNDEDCHIVVQATNAATAAIATPSQIVNKALFMTAACFGATTATVTFACNSLDVRVSYRVHDFS